MILDLHQCFQLLAELTTLHKDIFPRGDQVTEMWKGGVITDRDWDTKQRGSSTAYERNNSGSQQDYPVLPGQQEWTTLRISTFSVSLSSLESCRESHSLPADPQLIILLEKKCLQQRQTYKDIKDQKRQKKPQPWKISDAKIVLYE